MRDSFLLRVLLLVGLVLPVTGCSNSIVDRITVSPTTQSLTVGQTVQFTAIGTYTHRTGSPSTQDLTNQVNWSSSVPAIATVNSSGLATAVSPGTTTITATIAGYTGTLTATATITVTGLGGGSGSGSNATISSLAVIPGAQTVSGPSQTGQFIAIGSTSSGTTVNLTNQVAWSTSSSQIVTINSAGLASAVGQGTATITALYTNPVGGSTVTGAATFTVTGGTTEQYNAVTIIPGTQSLSASGQTGQFIALGTLGSSGLQQDVTSSPQLTWSSSIPSIATITSGGLATGVSAGSSTITAILKNPDGSIVSNTATVTVTTTPNSLLSLTIIPNSITVNKLQDTGQFLAIGTFSSSPTIRDLTNSVTWLSSEPNVYPVNSNGTGIPNPGAPAGVATAYGSGNTATIIAEATDPTTGSIQTATSTFSCCQGNSTQLLSTLTVYNAGLNTTNWLVTADSATGTKNVIHCGPGSNPAGYGDSVCVATYPVGSTVTLTAPAGAGAFGGWSSNCQNVLPVTASGPNSCTVTLTTNDTVGAIFN